jgi:tetratricopeptide (TPR) repeat protein
MRDAPDLSSIKALGRRGDMAGARREAEALLPRYPDHAELLELTGTIAGRMGDIAAACAYVRRAWDANPGSLPTRLHLINLLIMTGALAEAEALCVPGADGAGAPQLARLRGYVLQAQGRFAEAAACYEALVAQDPADFEIWNNLGNARAALEDYAGASQALARARDLKPDVAGIRFNLAAALAREGRLDESLEAYRAAATLDPRNPFPLLQGGMLLRQLGRGGEAVPLLSRAAELAPGDAAAYMELGRAFAGLQELEQAEQAYRRALAIDPASSAAYLELGIALERCSRLDRLEDLLNEADRQGIPSQDLAYLRALLLQRQRRPEEAYAYAIQVAEDVEPVGRAALIGKLADSLGNTDEAFAAFEAMNRLSAAEAPPPPPDPARYRRHIETLAATVDQAWVESWRPLPSNTTRPAPIFLIGFPRSGTTLLDTLLMGHPDVAVLEEEPILQRVSDAGGALADLPALTSEDAERLRTLYFAAADAADPVARFKRVVDKLPLNILGVPLIHRLFPDAKLIFAQRHPCDVVLSCFMQRFELNDAMANFLNLKDAARLYDQVLGFWQQCRRLLPLDVHTIRYEDLVEDAEAQMRPLLTFLGLPWDPRVMDHQRTAKARGTISTPSYAQVTQAIHTQARGRWQSYAEQLAEVLPVLAPWAAELGYGEVG